VSAWVLLLGNAIAYRREKGNANGLLSTTKDTKEIKTAVLPLPVPLFLPLN